MPKVNKYKNKDGIYIRAAQGGQITTYQVTKEGEEAIRRTGNGENISPSLLQCLKEQGLVYTGGTGPGVISSDPEPVAVPAPRRKEIASPPGSGYPLGPQTPKSPPVNYTSNWASSPFAAHSPPVRKEASEPRSLDPIPFSYDFPRKSSTSRPSEPIELPYLEDKHYSSPIGDWDHPVDFAPDRIVQSTDAPTEPRKPKVVDSFETTVPLSPSAGARTNRHGSSTHIAKQLRSQTDPERPRPSAPDDAIDVRGRSDTLAVVMWTIAGIILIFLFFAFVLMIAKKH
jgi:hypothetical protein